MPYISANALQGQTFESILLVKHTFRRCYQSSTWKILFKSWKIMSNSPKIFTTWKVINFFAVFFLTSTEKVAARWYQHQHALAAWHRQTHQRQKQLPTARRGDVRRLPAGSTKAPCEHTSASFVSQQSYSEHTVWEQQPSWFACSLSLSHPAVSGESWLNLWKVKIEAVQSVQIVNQ